MTRTAAKRRAVRRQAGVLAGILILQTAAAVFFVGDVTRDFRQQPFSAYLLFEALVSLALVFGVVLGVRATSRTLDLMRAQESALAAASGALAEVIEGEFKLWSLTPAECEVGLLALKGFDVAEIAELRRAAQGTVRAQLTRIYAKAGVSNRAQLTAHFVEDLLNGPIPAATDGGAYQSATDDQP